MSNTIKPKVTLVGAGPGDPDLLTLKGVKALAEANVVLYDALANEEIMFHAPQDAIKIFVGKRIGAHAYSQDQINQLIVDNALTYGHVVRLKGGDPFIFGRGSEEIAWNFISDCSSCLSRNFLDQKRNFRKFLGNHRNYF
jgi:uroporphyrin-III C-methyltransferase